MRIFNYLWLFFLACLLPSSLEAYSYEDYKLYLKAKENFEEKNYQKAKEGFLQVQRMYPYSPIHKKKYSDYFLGLSNLHLGEEEAALPLLLSSVLPDYEVERNLNLASIYAKEGKKEEAAFYYERLLSNQYSYEVAQMEKEILPKLWELKPYYRDYYALKYEGQLSKASALRKEDILGIAQFFSSKGEEANCQKLLSSFIEERGRSEKELFPYYQVLISSYFASQDYKKILGNMNFFLKTDAEHKGYYLLQKARAFALEKDYMSSIFWYQEVKDPQYLAKAKSELAGLYYFLEDYAMVLECLQEKDVKTLEDWKLLGDSYYALGKRDAFLKVTRILYQLQASTYENVRYQFLVKYPNIRLEHLDAVFFTNLIVDSYLQDLYPFDFQAWKASNSLEYQKLLDLKGFHDKDIIRLELENSQFYNISSLENSYFMTKYYEYFKLYDLAFQNSLKNRGNFGKYKNLLPLLYPCYYQDLVHEAALNYSIPEEVLDTLILLASQWDTTFEEKNRVGLFALEAKEERDFRDLKDPKISLERACQKWKALEKIHPQVLPCIYAFLYGEEALSKLPFEENGDIYLSKLSNYQERQKLQELLLSYTCYKKLYYF